MNYLPIFGFFGLFDFITSIALIPWLILISGLSITSFYTYKEKYFIGTLTLIAMYVGVDWFYDFGVSKFLYHNPMQLFYYFSIYVGCGLMVAIILFMKHMSWKVYEYKDLRAKYMETTKCSSEGYQELFPFPSFRSCANNVGWWMALWPFFIFKFVVRDALRAMFEWIANIFSGLFKFIYNKYKQQIGL